MSKGPNQKQKLLYIQKFLQERTDENNGVTVNEIIDYLEENGVTAERKSIYTDIKTLQDFGMDIEKCKSKAVTYKLLSREFELPELKLLVDAVQSSKFITKKKSVELIKKVEGLASQHQGKQLNRQVFVSKRVKTKNEQIYYNIDKLYSAIDENKKVSFNYYEWAVNFNGGEKVLRRKRRNGKIYQVSPWAMTWDDENYYLIGYDTETDSIRHYRVDKMEKITITLNDRDGQSKFKRFDLATYSKRVFGMFGGEEVKVRLMFSNDLVGVVVDRFGKDIAVYKVNENSFLTDVSVNLSTQFYGWLFGLGAGVKIVSPQWVAEEYQEKLASVTALYKHI